MKQVKCVSASDTGFCGPIEYVKFNEKRVIIDLNSAREKRNARISCDAIAKIMESF